MKRIKQYESFLIAVLKWLKIEYFDIRFETSLASETIIRKYVRVLRTRGKKEAIRFCKERRASIYQWLTTIDSLDYKSRSKSSGLPKDLRFLKHTKQLTQPLLRLVLTALYASRGLELPATPNVDTITKEPTHGRITKYNKHIKAFWLHLGYSSRVNLPKRILWKDYHFTTKTGPNGHALWSSLADLAALPDSLVESIKVVGGKKLAHHMEVLRKYLPHLLPLFGVQPNRYRKVSAISDQEGKTREIAILDYFSQTALRGLHKYLYRLLRRITQDCTYDQGSFKHKIESMVNNNHKYYSCDLTAATDRFPMEFICNVLKGRLTDDYVNSWRDIMVGYPFESTTGPLRYAVGNPMGAYSSWASFAVAHHYVVFYCCKELGINWSDAPYVMLGDDIVIKHDALAQLYMETMRDLGVDISIEKSHISTNVFEFAKRTFYIGQEITPFPISALYSTRKCPSLLMNVLVNEEKKGWSSLNGIPTSLSELYRRLGFNATFVAKKRRIFFIAHNMVMGLGGHITAWDCIRNVTVEYYPDLIRFVNKYSAKQDFAAILSRSLQGSLDQNKDNKPLGVIAEKLVMFITGKDELVCDAIGITMALPLLRVHGKVEQVWLDTIKSSLIPDQKIQLGETWKDFCRAVLIPSSDEIYYCRNQDLLMMAAFTLGKELDSSLAKQLNRVRDWGLGG